ncbi:hypothetical protein BB560_006560 [Smittium megazygosporum]|uniref:Superoxide dismutase copper/zinc binding domain-containing protein n=1 Tax=Smittium megazygosporum TaxID=133381 RepID=A0A2T9Y409_9FUNG|nr:hypothetical protein BB560_006560 [Smittium megazygosporum]
MRSLVLSVFLAFLVLFNAADAAFGNRARARINSRGISGIIDFTVVLRPYPPGFPITNDGMPNVTPMFVNVTLSGLTPGINYNYYIASTPIAQDDGTCASVQNILFPRTSRPVPINFDGAYSCNKSNIIGTCAFGDISGINRPVRTSNGVFYDNLVLNYLKIDNTSDPFNIIGKALVIRRADGNQVACTNIYVLNKCPS